MRLLALWLGKLIYFGLRIIRRRGSALPGLVVEKIYPDFLNKTLAKLPNGVIVITGTNGKTTSTKMLAHILNANNRVLTNSTGSNFTRGIIATTIHHSKLTGKLPYDIAVIELDEAYAALFADSFRPRGLVVTNIMRDQMDRFGEIDKTAKLIQKVVEKTTEFVVLNRDDERVAKLSSFTKSQVFYFGVDPSLRQLYLNDDELHEQTALKMSNEQAEAELLAIQPDNKILIRLGSQEYTVIMTASSSFNYQNAVAVCAAASAMGIEDQVIINRIKDVKPAFGRGENINTGNKSITLQLVKNPGGFRHALHSLSDKKTDCCMIAINDNYADGRDISWLWDVDFGKYLSNRKSCSIFVSGTRAADMALRLKYDNIRIKDSITDLDECLETAIKNTPNRGHLLIFTTYTAMLHLRKSLAKKTELDKV